VTTKGGPVTFLSCFKCGRIVRSADDECPRCGMRFGQGTLFECPFCAGLVWRNAEQCPTCKTDLIKFSKEIADSLKNFSMDGFVGDIIHTELEMVHPEVMRVSCPSCGLMIHGDEERCPRCDMLLHGSKVDCPVCGEKVIYTEGSCWNCGTPFFETPPAPPLKAEVEAPVVHSDSKKAPKEKKRRGFGRK
jgi:RNA polymerase subunit RPABC4/transcription elongation factor Spt4